MTKIDEQILLMQLYEGETWKTNLHCDESTKLFAQKAHFFYQSPQFDYFSVSFLYFPS